MLPRLSSLLANSILANELYVPEIVLPNDSRIFPHVTQLTHTGPLNALGIEGKAIECFFDGREAAMPAKASARLLSARLIFSIVHSVNCFKVFLTLAKSGVWRRIEQERGPIRTRCLIFCFIVRGRESQPDGLLQCSPVGDCSRSPTPEPDEREAPSTRRVHHSCLLDSWCWLGLREYSNTNILPVKSGCAECCEGAGQLVRSLDELGNKGGASGQRFEGLRLLAPFLNIWFLRLPMPC
ncbi:hypothetical protein CK203_006776 [Vitis vinifera]|uniref:Uncharacterized protein n=1 Tax=Vitis vinifera TaxID=29760 RepID=A0A438KBE7_VITVI|nr:hypothetical protein CK203_006776 [Vitis vinifera]